MAEDMGSSGIDVGATRVPLEEIRFGVILNGGVSLAVWMGGAVRELDRLTKAEGETATVYGRILDAAGCKARADVISGTSAGGINGAALALTQVNTLADIASLRDIWVDQGQLETLLRKPFRGEPTSLLQGDEYFLPALNAALSRLAVPAVTRPVDVAPIDLTITATVLHGNQTVAVDDMGQLLPQQVHAARFHWNRQDGSGDPFAAANILDTARHLALAARCTASFPVAFEPVFVPVGRPDGVAGGDPRGMTEEQFLRPDMSGLVEDWGDKLPVRDRSRYVVDGGVLANTPTRAALKAVEAMDPRGPVRRVMLMLYPHAGTPGADPADDPDRPPTLTGTLSGLLGALTAQGGRTFVEEFERHNRAAAGRRGTRQDILDSLVRERRKPPKTGGTVDVRLKELAAAMLPQYRRLRQWRAGRDLATKVLDIVSTDRNSAALAGDFGFERVRRAAENAQKAWEEQRGRSPHPDRPYVPYVPDELEDALGLAGTHDPAIWGWGVEGALGVAEAAADLARRLVWVLHEGADYETVVAARAVIAETTKALHEDRKLVDDIWEAAGSVGRTLTPDEAYWTLRLAWYERMMLHYDSPTELELLIETVARREGGREQVRDERKSSGEVRFEAVSSELRSRMYGAHAPHPGLAGRAVHEHAMQVVRTLAPLLPILERVVSSPSTGLQDSILQLRPWRALFMQEHGGMVDDEDELLRRLLYLEVAASSLGDEVRTGATLPVELVQLSAQTVNGFAQVTKGADAKLGGMSVNRFGGFLKRSWRVNDWTWGRLDAATILCRTVLEPSRLRRAAAIRGQTIETGDPMEAATEAVDLLLGDVDIRKALLSDPRAKDTYRRAVIEMAGVLDTRTRQSQLPASMPSLAELCAWAIHLEIVAEELPVLARAVAADDVDGANARSKGKVLVAENTDLINALTAPAPAVEASGREASGAQAPTDLAGWYDLRMRALRVFDRAGVGRESLEDEVASDQMIRTATTAAAVATTVVDSDRSGLGRVKAVTRTLRGGMLLPYWVVNALTSRRVIARSLALLGLAVGGVFLALALFGVLPEWLAGPGALLGASALLVVLAYSALRTGTLLHGLLLLTPVAALVAFAVDQAWSPEPGGAQKAAQDAAAQGTVTLLVVLGLALALMALGSIPAATGSVWAALDALARRQHLRLPRQPRRPETRSFGARLGWFLRRVGHVLLLALVRLLGLLKALLTLAVPALVAAVVGVVVAWAVFDPWPGLLDFVREHQEAFVVGAVVAVVVGAFLAWWLGRRLQVLRRVGGLPDSDADAWVYKTLAHPAGAAVGWAVLYGFGYLLFAAFLVADPFTWTDTVWGRALLLTSALLGAALVAVLPWWLPLRAVRSMERETLARTRTTPLAAPPAEGAQLRRRALQRTLTDDLVSRGVSYRWLVSPAADIDDVRPRLRRRGRRLARRIDRQQTRRAGPR